MAADGATRSDRDIPLPPTEFMDLVCGPGRSEAFESTGRALVEALDQQRMIRPGTRFLDVGCGCGRVARHLLGSSLQSYVGFDRNPEMIRWCQRELTSRAGHFQFEFFDLTSAYTEFDNRPGSIPAEDFRFPYAAQEFDSVHLASVFTHMPLREIERYLGQVFRVLSAEGEVLLSVFFSDRERPYVEYINFLHRLEEFEDLLARSGFQYSRAAEARFGLRHNWYVLTKTTERSSSPLLEPGTGAATQGGGAG